MPTQSVERWIYDGNNMKRQLEDKGYKVELQYAADDSQVQIEQIEHMIAKGVNCLVICPVNSNALTTVEASAKAAGIPIIAYNRLLMDTDAVSYYVTFDNKGIGRLIGQTIESKAKLKETRAHGQSKTIEFFMGSPDDSNALYLYNGLMEVLKPYLDDGTLVCKSGRTSFDSTCILQWSKEIAQERCETYLASVYANGHLDICVAANDAFSYACRAALSSAGYTASNWPIISGQDAETIACKNILAGTQAFSIYNDTRLLASQTVAMVDALLNGLEPEINDREQYHNGKMIVPSYLCTPVVVDADNLREVVVDSGYLPASKLGL